jgi:hypothetical protein
LSPEGDRPSRRRFPCEAEAAVRPVAAARFWGNLLGGGDNVPLIQIVIVLIVAGVLMWLINRFIPMAGPIKSLLNAVVVIVLVIWVLKAFGLWHYVTSIRVGR